VKHIIEPRVTYKYVTGIDNFANVIRFDENDLVTNTNQIEFSITNRLLAKDKNGTISDFLTWQLYYDRYFDPTFGGAVVAGQPDQRNVLLSTIDLTGYAFLDRPRHSSPVVSALRLQSKVGVEWRTDYDPLRHGISNSSVTIDGRINQYFWSLGHTEVHTDPVLMPSANQLRASVGYGGYTRRGWNYSGSAYYDFRQGRLQYWQTHVTYNTDCCGFSVQYRRFSVGTRDDSQIQVAFAVANLGTFGTLKRQERVF
jgi:LPS-assembly protein